MLSEKVGRVLNHIALTLSPAISQLADFVALEKLNMVVFEFEKQDTEQKIEDEKILAEGFGKVIDVLSERLTKSK